MSILTQLLLSRLVDIMANHSSLQPPPPLRLSSISLEQTDSGAEIFLFLLMWKIWIIFYWKCEIIVILIFIYLIRVFRMAQTFHFYMG